jgi:hypothetical protein
MWRNLPVVKWADDELPFADTTQEALEAFREMGEFMPPAGADVEQARAARCWGASEATPARELEAEEGHAT